MVSRMASRAFFGRRLVHLIIFLVVGTAYWLGFLDFLEYKLIDTRFDLLRRETSGDIVLIEIDAPSLQQLDVWPWPRSYHAKLIDNLLAAGVRRIALDIDFSSRSTPAADRDLERALASAGGRVILPAFTQMIGVEPDGMRTVFTAPLPALARHVGLSSVNIAAEADGRVRRIFLAEPWGDLRLPSLFALLALPDGSSTGSFHIDYGIRPDTIPRLSYADVLLGRFDPDFVRGKDILVGSTAVELGDQLSVPVFNVRPGSVVQALAYESLVQGRTLQRFAREPILLATLLLVVLLGPRFQQWPWRRCLSVLCGFVAAVLLLSLAVQAVVPVILDVVPWLLAMVLSYGAALVRRVDQQDLSLLAQSLSIRRKDAFMRQVVENSFDGILALDQHGVVRSFNRAAEQILGIAATSAIGRQVRDLAPSGLASEVGKSINKILQLRGGAHQLQVDRPNGLHRAIHIAVSETVVNGECMVIVLLHDVSGEKLAEARAAEARNRLNEAVECINDGFALYDQSDRLVLSNSRFREIHFGSAEPLPPRWSFEEAMRIAAEHGHILAARGRVEDWLRKRIRFHQNRAGSHEERLDNGTCLRVSERATGDGGTVAVYTDVTDMKAREKCLRASVEEAEMANRSKTEFLANMSHELRTPLNAIIGFSEMMVAETLGPVGSPQYKDYAGDILYSGRHLLDIINDILDVSKIDAGQHELREAAVDTQAVIRACLRLVEERASVAGHEIRTDLDVPLPVLYADERAFKQILLNLLSNAIKFTPSGGNISLRAFVAEDGNFVVQIADSGVGIAERNIPKALSLFGQVDGDLARKHEGTGLGLPLSCKLMEIHDGTLDLTSEPSAGTTVTLSFPAARVLDKSKRSNAQARRR